MAKAVIDAGICGYQTVVEAEKGDSYQVSLHIESGCAAINRMADHLDMVNALNEISFRRDLPETIQQGIDYCSHAACPVPSGIIKAVEVAAGLALPKDVTIKLAK